MFGSVFFQAKIWEFDCTSFQRYSREAMGCSGTQMGMYIRAGKLKAPSNATKVKTWVGARWNWWNTSIIEEYRRNIYNYTYRLCFSTVSILYLFLNLQCAELQFKDCNSFAELCRKGPNTLCIRLVWSWLTGFFSEILLNVIVISSNERPPFQSLKELICLVQKSKKKLKPLSLVVEHMDLQATLSHV